MENRQRQRLTHDSQSRRARMERAKKRRRRAIRNRIIFGVVLLAILAGIGYAMCLVLNKTSMELNIADGSTITAEYGNPATLPEVSAVYKGTIFNKDGVTVKAEPKGEIDYNNLGSYPVVFEASYKGKKAAAQLTVNVVDTTPPVINLVSKENYVTPQGMPYREEGYNAIDNVDGDITAAMQAVEENGVVTYTVTDSHGNTATATREIKYADKVVYLTFDDGPGKYTDHLLDILAKYGVKVTFFVTNQFPNYINCISREVAEGHSVAVHSYTHDWNIYTSSETYWADYQQMADLIVQQGGEAPTIFRFPGGSGNSASRKYCEGIMTQLVAETPTKGFEYFDWNVNSTDADNVTTDPNEVAAAVIAGIQKHPISIVLQHDIKEYSVEAVDQIVSWGLQNGYTFLPLDRTSWVYHGPTIRN